MFALYRFLYLLLSLVHGVSDIFMSAFQMELNDYPHFNLAEGGSTHPSSLRWGHSGLPLPTIHGPRHGPVRGQRDDTLRPHRAMVGVHHRQ
jgi:hypothetical protein